MAVTKNLAYIGADSAKTIFATLMRQRDGAYLDSDFKYRETPTAPAQAFTEKTLAGMLSKNYLWSNATTVWENGHYTVSIYDQAGDLWVDATHVYVPTADNTIADANWRKIAHIAL